MKMRQLSAMRSREGKWKLVSTVTGVLGALLAKRLIRAAYGAVRMDKDPATPFDPTDTRFSWPDALLWAAAGGIGLGIAKVLSARLAAIGWEAATGAPPRDIVEQPEGRLSGRGVGDRLGSLPPHLAHLR